MIAAGTTLTGTTAERLGLVSPTRGGWQYYETDGGIVYHASEDGTSWLDYVNLPNTHYIIFTNVSGGNLIRFPNALASGLEFSSSVFGYLRFDTIHQRRIDFNYTQDDIDFFVYYDTGVGFFVNGLTGAVEMGGVSCGMLGNLGVGITAPGWIVDIRGSDPIVSIMNTDTAAVGEYCEVRYRVDDGIFSFVRGGIDFGATTRGFWSVHTRNGAAYPERVRVNYQGYVGIGVDQPARLLHVYISDSVNTAVTWTNRYSHESTGTIVAGHGVGVECTITDTGATQQIAGRWSVVWTHASNKDASFRFDLMSGGAAPAQKAELTHDGDWKIVRDFYSAGNQGLTTSFTTGDARTATFTGGILTGLV